jgi:hypothetical protein
MKASLVASTTHTTQNESDRTSLSEEKEAVVEEIIPTPTTTGKTESELELELESESESESESSSFFHHRPPSSVQFGDAEEELGWYKNRCEEQAEEMSRLLVSKGTSHSQSPSCGDEKDVVIGEFARARLQWEHEREDIHEVLEKVKKDLREKSLHIDRLNDKVANLQSDNEKFRNDHLTVSKLMEITSIDLKRATEELCVAKESLEEKSQELKTCQKTRKLASITIRKLKAELRESSK